ncbi:prolyl oligopeptidase family serine peptidase [Chitinophaga pinensis]|uniref:Prolyl oligopeptidase family serine peptidase n=1 Tax=Chitinophaga pinensis TaxID=79329 RepID=A0A5C6LTQ2_9BACT|nr:prolyl oligopeptidase family serine peptidase [Chitinophaga pinensis]TWW00651.1 prolyl oligopeptidase family serine peptidase [Chitinophaga pinensis]
MKYLFILLFFCQAPVVHAQKPAITNMTYKGWDMLLNYNIADNGKYIWYTYGSELAGTSLVVRSVKGNYSRIFTGVMDAAFTADNQHLVFSSPQGLGILTPARNIITYDKRLSNYHLPMKGNGRWLTASAADTLVLKDLHSGNDYTFQGISASLLNQSGTVLLLKFRDSLIWLDLTTMRRQKIASGSNIDNLTFAHADTAIAFTSGTPPEMQLYHFCKGADSGRAVINPQLPSLANMPLQFSNDDQLLFFKTVKLRDQTAEPFYSKVSVWDYRDVRLQSQSAPDPYEPYTAVVPVAGGVVRHLEHIDTTLIGIPGNRYALVSDVVNVEDGYWNNQQINSYDLISLTDGGKKQLIRAPERVTDISLSPGERFVIWYDVADKQYVSYETATGKTRHLTQSLQTSLIHERINRKEIFTYGIAGWLANDERVLVYDAYDIWMLDPSGVAAPVNITSHYGKRHQTILRVVYPQQLPTLSTGAPLLVTCLDSNKNNGFMHITLGANPIAAPVRMDPVVYHFPSLVVFEPPPPMKAKKADIYLLQRQSATQAPNLIVTTDFNLFSSISDIQPQHSFNWLTAELVHWPVSDSLIGTGILYKPENFDSTKRYPVIFTYYEERSNELNIFPHIRLSTGTLTTAWYVSNGYLVFIPDIYRPTGKSGAAILNTVESAARYLSLRPYVDAAKLGLQGHSFGGYETNYIIAHSDLFAAAQSSAGPAELFGLHGGLGFSGRSYHFISEVGQMNQGIAPWEDPSLYIQGSPVLFADKINTPLLMMHNKEDGAVPFSQSVALFTALRRLGKPAWLLEYKGEGHVLYDWECQLDFTKRQEAFLSNI